MSFKTFTFSIAALVCLVACQNQTPKNDQADPNKTQNGVELVVNAFAEGKNLNCPDGTKRVEKMDSSYPEFYCVGPNGRIGTWLEYDRYGRMTKRANFSDDKFNGEWLEYHPNGKIDLKGTMQDNMRVGEWTQWYVTGEKRSIKHFKDNVIHGKTEIFYKNGHLMGEGEFVNNFEEGIWKLYTPEGKLARECTFEGGEEKGCVIHIKEFQPKSKTFGGDRQIKVTEDSAY